MSKSQSESNAITASGDSAQDPAAALVPPLSVNLDAKDDKDTTSIKAKQKKLQENIEMLQKHIIAEKKKPWNGPTDPYGADVWKNLLNYASLGSIWKAEHQQKIIQTEKAKIDEGLTNIESKDTAIGVIKKQIEDMTVIQALESSIQNPATLGQFKKDNPNIIHEEIKNAQGDLTQDAEEPNKALARLKSVFANAHPNVQDQNDPTKALQGLNTKLAQSNETRNADFQSLTRVANKSVARAQRILFEPGEDGKIAYAKTYASRGLLLAKKAFDKAGGGLKGGLAAVVFLPIAVTAGILGAAVDAANSVVSPSSLGHLHNAAALFHNIPAHTKEVVKAVKDTFNPSSPTRKGP